MIAQHPDLWIINDDAIQNLAQIRRRPVCKEVIALVRFPRLVAPEALDLSAMLRPVAIVEPVIGEGLEELGMGSAAIDCVPVPRGVQITANDEPPAGRGCDQLPAESSAILFVVSWTDMNACDQHRDPGTAN